MTPFSTLSEAIINALTALDVCAGVSIIQDDDQNIVTEVAKATGSIGMMILLSVPDFKNKDATLSNVVNADLFIEILVREVPAIWRAKSKVDKGANTIHCSDLGQAIAPVLQGLQINGFQPLRVIDGKALGSFTTTLSNKTQIVFQDYLLRIESMQIFE